MKVLLYILIALMVMKHYKKHSQTCLQRCEFSIFIGIDIIYVYMCVCVCVHACTDFSYSCQGKMLSDIFNVLKFALFFLFFYIHFVFICI